MANYNKISKITLPSGGDPYELLDAASMHWLGKTTTQITDQATTSSIVVGTITYSTATTTESATQKKLRANSFVTYGTSNTNFIFDGVKWNIISESVTIPDVPVQDVEVDGTSVLNTTTHTAEIGTTGEAAGQGGTTPYDATTNPLATKAYVDALPAPMVYRGTVGTDGTVSTLPVDGSANIGDTYKVITAGTYGSPSHEAKVGDIFICQTKVTGAQGSNTWDWVPSGDEKDGVEQIVAGTGLTGGTITTSGTIAVNLLSPTGVSGDLNPVVVEDTGKYLAVKNRATEGNYDATTNKITTKNYVDGAITSAIQDLDVTGASGIGKDKTIASWSQLDGEVSITTQDIEISVDKVTDVTATTTINHFSTSQSSILTGIDTAAPSSTVPEGGKSIVSYDDTTETLTIRYLTASSTSTSPVNNVVVKPTT